MRFVFNLVICVFLAQAINADNFILRSHWFYPKHARIGDTVVGTFLIDVNGKHDSAHDAYSQCLAGFIGSSLRDERGSSCTVSYLNPHLIEVRVVEKITSSYGRGRFKLYHLVFNSPKTSLWLDHMSIPTKTSAYFEVH